MEVEMELRCGDTVCWQLTGERLKVAWSEGEMVGLWGRGMNVASMADCSAAERCTDAEHRAAVRQWFDVTPKASVYWPRMERLYGTALSYA
jgi:hypothetical protein